MVIAPVRWSGEELVHFAAKNPDTYNYSNHFSTFWPHGPTQKVSLRTKSSKIRYSGAIKGFGHLEQLCLKLLPQK